MNYLYLDLETIPTQSAEIRAEIAASVTPPGNISKAETIAQWIAEKKPAAVNEAIARTSFDGASGHICCIGWAFDGSPAVSDCMNNVDQERDMIRDFLRTVEAAVGNDFQVPAIVGHNVVNFDIRFIWQRAIILGVRMPTWFPREPKPWSPDVFDTMTAFAGSRNTIGMDRLSRALGFEGKGEIDGSMVAALWDAGEYDRIASYCRDDIDRTREIHRKMLVAFGEVV